MGSVKDFNVLFLLLCIGRSVFDLISRHSENDFSLKGLTDRETHADLF